MKNIKVIVILVCVLLIGSLLFGGILALLINQGSQTYQTTYPEVRNQAPQIYFDNSSFSYKLEIIEMLNSLKPEYFSAIDKIYFTEDQNLVDSICHNSCWGVNTRYIQEGTWHSEIYILVDENMSRVKNTLCHEITHQFIKSEEYFHKFAYDLASEGVCYE